MQGLTQHLRQPFLMILGVSIFHCRFLKGSDDI